MTTRSVCGTRGARRGLRRRGSALIMVLLMVAAFGGLAAASVFLMSNSELFTRAAVKESDLRNAADAGLEMARSRVDRRGSTIQKDLDTLYWNAAVLDAKGDTIPGVRVKVFAGLSGDASGQFGYFMSLVSQATDARGNSFVRRSELAQESFAKFAYWTNFEKDSSGGTIVFAAGDQIRGPMWTNDVITINSGSPKAKFWDEVRTAKTITNASNGEFVKGYKINQPEMKLPPNTALSRLGTYASQAGYNIIAPNSSNETGVMMRIEFLATDLNGDADSTDVDEGFFRVFTASAGRLQWLRADWGASPNAGNTDHCGDWHPDTTGAKLKFYPASVHSKTWFKEKLKKSMSSFSAGLHSAASLNTIMAAAGARCYPAGDPHLAAVERRAAEYPDSVAHRFIGGEDTTFTPVGLNGSWREFPAVGSPAHPKIVAARPYDARYLHPLSRELNLGFKGVINVAGSVAINGVVRGKVTLYAQGGTILILDDVRYAHDPGAVAAGATPCQDMLGMIASNDIVVADNSINTPAKLSGSSTYRSYDETKDLFIHGTVMALNTSFKVQNHGGGPSSATNCEGKTNGRGCLYLTGGIIQVRRGIVGRTGGEGYIKRYSYDRCAADSPPPYFPVTGRYVENAYLEVDPANFDVVKFFKRLRPNG